MQVSSATEADAGDGLGHQHTGLEVPLMHVSVPAQIPVDVVVCVDTSVFSYVAGPVATPVSH